MSYLAFRIIPVVTTVVVVAGLSGCNRAGKSSFEPTGKHKMAEIGQMLNTIKDSGEGPPAGPNDLARIEPLVPLGVAEIRSGDIVYLWGVGLDANSPTKVLAYEKKVTHEGGWVLMMDGSIKQMTADEFKSAPKAK
jgi:hypothetical protein